MENEKLIKLFFNSLKEYLNKEKLYLIGIKVNKVFELDNMNKQDNEYDKLTYADYFVLKWEIHKEIDKLDEQLAEINIILRYITEIDIKLIDDLILENIYKKIIRNYKDYEFPQEIKNTFLYKKILTDLTL